MPGCITTSSQVAICMGLAPQLSMSLILNPWVPSLGCEHDAGGPLSVALLAVAGGTYGVRTMWSLRLSRWWMSYPSPHRLRHPYLRIPHSSYHRHRQLAACSVHYRRRNHPTSAALNAISNPEQGLPPLSPPPPCLYPSAFFVTISSFLRPPQQLRHLHHRYICRHHHTATSVTACCVAITRPLSSASHYCHLS